MSTRKKKNVAFILGLFALTSMAVLYYSIQKDYSIVSANVEALSGSEKKELCSSPKTALGTGHCMNVTSIPCKDDTGNCK